MGLPYDNDEYELHDVSLPAEHTWEDFWALAHKLTHMLAHLHLVADVDGLAEVATTARTKANKCKPF